MRKQVRGARNGGGGGGAWEVEDPSRPSPLPTPAPGSESAGRQCVGTKSAYLCERRNEAGNADQTGVGKQLGHLGNPADIFLSVSRGESKVFVQAVADVVPIQGVAGDGVGDQVLLQSKTDGRLPSTGETCSEQARQDRH